MPLLSEWSKYDPKEFERKKDKEIPQENNALTCILNKEHNEIMCLFADHKINEKQRDDLMNARDMLAKLYNEKPSCQRDAYEHEKNIILGNKISLEEELRSIELQTNPVDYASHEDVNIKKTISSIYNKVRDGINKLLEPKKTNV